MGLSVKRLSNGPQTTCQISAQSVQPFPRYRKGYISARAHVQMYSTHDLGNMHRCLVSKRTPNLATIGRAIPELQLSGQFWHPSRGTRCPPRWPPPKWAKFGFKQLLLNRTITMRRPRVNQTHSLVDKSFFKSVTTAGRSYWLFSIILKQTSAPARNDQFSRFYLLEVPASRAYFLYFQRINETFEFHARCLWPMVSFNYILISKLKW